jgi:hypothetical protein
MERILSYTCFKDEYEIKKYFNQNKDYEMVSIVYNSDKKLYVVFYKW